MSRGIPQVNAITLEQLKSYCFQNGDQPISYSQSYDLYAITRNSFLTYHNNALYIGYYTSNSASVLEEYDITEDGTLQTSTVDDDTITTGQLGVDSLTPLALPSGMRVITERAQGVAFYKNRILTSHSYGVLPGSLKVFPNSLQMLLERRHHAAEDSVFRQNSNRSMWMVTISMYCLNPLHMAIAILR